MSLSTERASAAPQPVSSTRAARARRNWASWVLALNAAWSYLFLYAPILILILFSFNQSRFGAKWTGWTLDWYRQMVRDDRIADAFQTTMLIAITSTVIATTIGTMLALALERYRFRGRTALDATLYLPIIIPDIVMAVALLAFFSFTFRLLNATFGLSMRNGLATVIIAHVAFNISFVTVVVRASLRNFDRRLEEAAQDLGANPWQTFRHVTLPLIMPGIIGGALIAFTLSLDDFVVTFFTSGPGVNTLPLEVYSRVRKTITPEINAVSTLMLLGSIVLVAASLLLQRRGR
ncbi:MAG TPA: ABC transporter permease [Herpetosiphonaceae bacterium]